MPKDPNSSVVIETVSEQTPDHTETSRSPRSSVESVGKETELVTIGENTTSNPNTNPQTVITIKNAPSTKAELPVDINSLKTMPFQEFINTPLGEFGFEHEEFKNRTYGDYISDRADSRTLLRRIFQKILKFVSLNNVERFLLKLLLLPVTVVNWRKPDPYVYLMSMDEEPTLEKIYNKRLGLIFNADKCSPYTVDQYSPLIIKDNESKCLWLYIEAKTENGIEIEPHLTKLDKELSDAFLKRKDLIFSSTPTKFGLTYMLYECCLDVTLGDKDAQHFTSTEETLLKTLFYIAHYHYANKDDNKLPEIYFLKSEKKPQLNELEKYASQKKIPLLIKDEQKQQYWVYTLGKDEKTPTLKEIEASLNYELINNINERDLSFLNDLDKKQPLSETITQLYQNLIRTSHVLQDEMRQDSPFYFWYFPQSNHIPTYNDTLRWLTQGVTSLFLGAVRSSRLWYSIVFYFTTIGFKGTDYIYNTSSPIANPDGENNFDFGTYLLVCLGRGKTALFQSFGQLLYGPLGPVIIGIPFSIGAFKLTSFATFACRKGASIGADDKDMLKYFEDVLSNGPRYKDILKAYEVILNAKSSGKGIGQLLRTGISAGKGIWQLLKALATYLEYVPLAGYWPFNPYGRFLDWLVYKLSVDPDTTPEQHLMLGELLVHMARHATSYNTLWKILEAMKDVAISVSYADMDLLNERDPLKHQQKVSAMRGVKARFEHVLLFYAGFRKVSPIDTVTNYVTTQLTAFAENRPILHNALNSLQNVSNSIDSVTPSVVKTVVKTLVTTPFYNVADYGVQSVVGLFNIKDSGSSKTTFVAKITGFTIANYQNFISARYDKVNGFFFVPIPTFFILVAAQYYGMGNFWYVFSAGVDDSTNQIKKKVDCEENQGGIHRVNFAIKPDPDCYFGDRINEKSPSNPIGAGDMTTSIEVALQAKLEKTQTTPQEFDAIVAPETLKKTPRNINITYSRVVYSTDEASRYREMGTNFNTTGKTIPSPSFYIFRGMNLTSIDQYPELQPTLSKMYQNKSVSSDFTNSLRGTAGDAFVIPLQQSIPPKTNETKALILDQNPQLDPKTFKRMVRAAVQSGHDTLLIRSNAWGDNYFIANPNDSSDTSITSELIKFKTLDAGFITNPPNIFTNHTLALMVQDASNMSPNDRKISTLNLNFIASLKDNGVCEAAKLIRFNLKELQVLATNFGNQGINCIAQEIINNPGFIKKLWVGGNSFNDITLLKQALTVAKNLKEIHIGGNSNLLNFFVELSEAFANIETLIVRTGPFNLTLIEQMKLYNTTKYIDFSVGSIGNTGTKTLFERFENEKIPMEVIKISSNSVTNITSFKLPPSTQELSLANNQISLQELWNCLKKIKVDKIPLKNLDIGNIGNLGTQRINGTINLGMVLNELIDIPVETIRLTLNNIHYEDIIGWEFWKTNIKNIILVNNPLGPKGIQYFLEKGRLYKINPWQLDILREITPWLSKAPRSGTIANNSQATFFDFRGCGADRETVVLGFTIGPKVGIGPSNMLFDNVDPNCVNVETGWINTKNFTCISNTTSNSTLPFLTTTDNKDVFKLVPIPYINGTQTNDTTFFYQQNQQPVYGPQLDDSILPPPFRLDRGEYIGTAVTALMAGVAVAAIVEGINWALNSSSKTRKHKLSDYLFPIEKQEKLLEYKEKYKELCGKLFDIIVEHFSEEFAETSKPYTDSAQCYDDIRAKLKALRSNQSAFNKHYALVGIAETILEDLPKKIKKLEKLERVPKTLRDDIELLFQNAEEPLQELSDTIAPYHWLKQFNQLILEHSKTPNPNLTTAVVSIYNKVNKYVERLPKEYSKVLLLNDGADVPQEIAEDAIILQRDKTGDKMTTVTAYWKEQDSKIYCSDREFKNESNGLKSFPAKENSAENTDKSFIQNTASIFDIPPRSNDSTFYMLDGDLEGIATTLQKATAFFLKVNSETNDFSEEEKTEFTKLFGTLCAYDLKVNLLPLRKEFTGLANDYCRALITSNEIIDSSIEKRFEAIQQKLNDFTWMIKTFSAKAEDFEHYKHVNDNISEFKNCIDATKTRKELYARHARSMQNNKYSSDSFLKEVESYCEKINNLTFKHPELSKVLPTLQAQATELKREIEKDNIELKEIIKLKESRINIPPVSIKIEEDGVELKEVKLNKYRTKTPNFYTNSSKAGQTLFRSDIPSSSNDPNSKSGVKSVIVINELKK